MKIVLLGVAAGWWAFTLFAETPSSSEVGSTLGGAAGITSLGLVVWLLREHRNELKQKRDDHAKDLKETRDEFVRRETVRDELFNRTIVTIVSDFKTSLKEMRDENQRNVERQFQMAQQITSALEKVNLTLEAMEIRLDQIEDGGRGDLPPLPPHIVPPPVPGGVPSRRRGDQKHQGG